MPEMKFPRYVPPAAQKFFSVGLGKLSDCSEELKQEIAEKEKKQRSTFDALLDLNELRAIDRKVSERSDLIRRLAGLDTDAIIKPAYDNLWKEFREDGPQWVRFFAAAYESMRNYSEYRAKRKNATELLDTFGKQCQALINKTKKLQKTGVILPIELYNDEGDISYPQLYHIWSREAP